MSRTPLAALMVLLLLAVPAAQAGWLDRETVVTVAPERVGDRLQIAVETSVPEVRPEAGSDGTVVASAQARATHDVIVLVEGPSSAIDAYGIARETLAYRIDRVADGQLVHAARCHRLAGGVETVRLDHLEGTMGAMSWSVDGGSSVGPVPSASWSSSGSLTPLASFRGDACPIPHALSGRTLREGETLPLADLVPDAPPDVRDLESAPAEPTEHRGRPALALRFDISRLPGSDGGRGEARLVLADGLPGVAETTIQWTHEGRAYFERRSLVGYEPGGGETLPPPGDARLPERHPDARFAAPDPLALDDAAFALPLPYAEALAALRADPKARFEAWLAEHPDAMLVAAAFDREMRASQFAGATTEGGWILTFAEGTRAHTWTVVRVTGAATPLGAVASPKAIHHVEDNGDSTYEPAFVAPSFEVADGATLARVAEAHGVAAPTLRSLQYWLSPGDVGSTAVLVVSQAGLAYEGEGASEGLEVRLDPTRGAAEAVVAASYRSSGGILGLAPAAGGVDAPARGGFAALAQPETLAGGAAAAATGAGLLALLLKFVLLPLFTRLRRDRLLDNPVRARLYERVRAEPGIHRAELVDFAGIGEGATRHHLNQMVRNRLLVEVAQEGYVRYFAAGEVPPDVARREALLRAGSHRAVYDLYAREPHLSLREAGARLGMSAPSVHRAKKKLEAAGLLPAAPAPAAVAEA